MKSTWKRVVPLASLSVLIASGCETSQPARETCSAGDTAALESAVTRTAGIASFYSVEHCATRKVNKDDVEVACVVTALEKEIKLPTRWERQLATFVPVIVTQLAKAEDLAVATVYEKDDIQLYADDNLTRAVLYRPLASCVAS